jgi:uncharacterized repeat protein (TIGR04138 family)
MGFEDRKDPEILAVAEGDPRYAYEAYPFVLGGVEAAMAALEEARHVSGGELCESLRELALARFGPLAKDVLNFWGVRATQDFGNIVFNLVEAGLLLKTEEDSLADFIDVYDFDAAFEQESGGA